MAKRKEYQQALKMRKEGMPYSAIRKKLGVSKSTLSRWLRDHPLSKKQIDELRGKNPKRIEQFRQSMRRKRDDRLSDVLEKVRADIGTLSDRERFVAGFFLYWAEGAKTTPYSITLSNTDPALIRSYVQWLALLGVPKERIRVRLHLYSDMDYHTTTKCWSQELGIPLSQFRPPYIKQSRRADLSYRILTQGTCNVSVDNRDISEYVMQGLRYLTEYYTKP
ncbi:helix-turn-helix domain-containing protein [Patescibacteria group bacterium]|jgi:transposase-like protein|nr:helix-turn-helix domain-containing protein [Patescibacteria group bacterium]